ncbi:hypothetical protein B0H16DRAFT_1712931 [Mycena metata]|uniref:Uncharacterized protein n=1 Tax=Mycena metata TaxID=1033252 RepID=A0AAD7K000_9AGAR|nr:hypothetical protein B0H16DRAFT_1712931 [Mycena metata]
MQNQIFRPFLPRVCYTCSNLLSDYDLLECYPCRETARLSRSIQQLHEEQLRVTQLRRQSAPRLRMAFHPYSRNGPLANARTQPAASFMHPSSLGGMLPTFDPQSDVEITWLFPSAAKEVVAVPTTPFMLGPQSVAPTPSVALALVPSHADTMFLRNLVGGTDLHVNWAGSLLDKGVTESMVRAMVPLSAVERDNAIGRLVPVMTDADRKTLGDAIRHI